jgi:hypothetical protein
MGHCTARGIDAALEPVGVLGMMRRGMGIG